MENSDRQPSAQSNRGSKVIQIQTCKDCKGHRHSTWHDEAKYEANYNQVKTAIETLNPDVQVERKLDGPFILGGFEIMHGKQVLFSKKTSGLWPNASAVAQRVQLYFNDLDQGRDVSYYGTMKEKAYTPKKKARLGSAYSTGVGELNAFSNRHGKTAEGFTSPQKQNNNDVLSSPETGYKDPEEKNDEVEHKEEKPAPEEAQHHHEEKAEHKDHAEVKHEAGDEAKPEQEAPNSPVKQEAEHKPEEQQHKEPESAEPKSATENTQEVQKPVENQPEHSQAEADAQPKTENKEESAGLPPQTNPESQEAHHEEKPAVAQENKEEATAPETGDKIKAEKNQTEEYPEDFGN